jgi:hypothetical protein
VQSFISAFIEQYDVVDSRLLGNSKSSPEAEDETTAE